MAEVNYFNLFVGKRPQDLQATPFQVCMLNYLHAKKAEVSGLFEALIGLRKAGMTEDLRKNNNVADGVSFGSLEYSCANASGLDAAHPDTAPARAMNISGKPIC